jgi:hypothetical protein
MEKNGFKEDMEVKHVDAQVKGLALEEIDPIAERKLVRKLDLILLPMFCLVCKLMIFAATHYLTCTISIDCINFIDRHVLSECNIFVR